MKTRNFIFPKDLKNFSKIIVVFTCGNKIGIFPYTKVLWIDGSPQKNDCIEIIQCEVGKVLVLKTGFEDNDIFTSDFEISIINVSLVLKRGG